MLTAYIGFHFSLSGCQCFNPLAPGRSECDYKNVIFNLVLLIGIFRSSHDKVLRWMPHDHTADKSTLVQVMAWCHQATSHYLSQCWLSFLSPYCVARPQWVNEPSNGQMTSWNMADKTLWNPEVLQVLSSSRIQHNAFIKVLYPLYFLCDKAAQTAPSTYDLNLIESKSGLREYQANILLYSHLLIYE